MTPKEAEYFKRITQKLQQPSTSAYLAVWFEIARMSTYSTMGVSFRSKKSVKGSGKNARCPVCKKWFSTHNYLMIHMAGRHMGKQMATVSIIKLFPVYIFIILYLCYIIDREVQV